MYVSPRNLPAIAIPVHGGRYIGIAFVCLKYGHNISVTYESLSLADIFFYLRRRAIRYLSLA